MWGLMDGALEDETRRSLSEVAQQSANVVRKQIEGDFQSLQMVAALIGQRTHAESEQVPPLLDLSREQTSLKRMGIITSDGLAHTSDGLTLNMGDRDYYHRALRGETVLSGLLTDISDGKSIYVYATPVYSNGEIEAVLFATSAAETYSKMLDVELFEGRGTTCIFDENGVGILHSKNCQNFGHTVNAFEQFAGKDSAEAMKTLRADMKDGKGGVVECRRGGQKWYISYQPVGFNGWFVTSLAPESVVKATSARLSWLTLLACAIAVAVVCGMFLFIQMAQRRNRLQLEALAYTDSVTGGRNWNKLQLDVRALLKSAVNTQYAAVIFDVDKFKALNDLFGHKRGDETLRSLWKILSELLGPNEPFGRATADRFYLFLRYEGQESMQRRLEEMLRRAADYGETDLPHYALKLTFGVYPLEKACTDVSQMFDRADLARKWAKDNRFRRFAFYDHTLREQVLFEKQIENDMDAALRNGQFQVYLQPKYSITGEAVVGAEALVRWQHPEMGFLSPAQFIPLFERNGFILKLDTFMLESVCRLMRRWLEQDARPVPVSVNVSRLHLSAPDVVESLCRPLRENKLPPGMIELELTETTALDFIGTDKLKEIMERLHEAGFLLSIDDFGSGYSCVNLLQELPMDVIKLDRMFFGNWETNQRSRIVIADVVAMARHLEMEVVAEGVETADQVAFLAKIGCDVVQGFYYARPMPVAEFEQRLAPLPL